MSEKRPERAADNTCVCCGVVIPEGRQVCPSCELRAYDAGEFFSSERRKCMIHNIKILEAFADAVYSGAKPFELRKNDRGYQKGDILRFHVIDGKAFSRYITDHPLHLCEYEITYVLSGWHIEPNYVVLGIKPAELRRRCAV